MLLQALKVSVVLVPWITTTFVDYDNLVDKVNYYDLVSASEPIKEIVKENKIKVYVKTASWCRFCHQFIADYNSIKNELPYDLIEVPDEHGTNLPEIYWYKDGKRYFYNGYVHPKGIIQWL